MRQFGYKILICTLQRNANACMVLAFKRPMTAKYTVCPLTV